MLPWLGGLEPGPRCHTRAIDCRPKRGRRHAHSLGRWLYPSSGKARSGPWLRCIENLGPSCLAGRTRMAERIGSLICVCWLLALTLSALVGCATLSRDSFDQRYGSADPQRYDQPAAPAPGGVSWRADVQPILQRRCVVCHGCYDAPCQLKLGAWQGVARGGSSDNVYDTTRLREAAPSRLVRRRAAALAVAREGLLPGAERALADARGPACRQPAVPDAGAEAAAPAAGRAAAGRGFRFFARPRDGLPAHRAVRGPCAQVAAGRHALRPAGAGCARGGHPRALAASRRALRGRRAADGHAAPAGSKLGNLPQRGIAEGAADEPLPVRAPVPRASAFRGRCHAPRLPPGALEHAAGPAAADHRHAPALRRPRRRALLVPARARARSHPGEDAHALCAEPGAHGQVPQLVPGRRCPCRRAAVLCGGGGEQPLRDLSRAADRRALPLPARRSAVLHHELHQGPGVPRADGGGRDRGPVLGGLRRPEGQRRGDPGRSAAAPGREPDAAGRAWAAIRACSCRG